MPHHIELRLKSGGASPGDLKVSVQDRTFEYLMTSQAPEIRVSAYLDEDHARVERTYAEIFVHDTCPCEYRVIKIIPGSRTRPQVELPGPMSQGEQLTVLVERKE